MSERAGARNWRATRKRRAASALTFMDKTLSAPTRNLDSMFRIGPRSAIIATLRSGSLGKRVR
jgi:hypothetical protein